MGTGLGLSLSYDIVKAHGGEITVETSEELGLTGTSQLDGQGNSGSIFIIKLPVK